MARRIIALVDCDSFFVSCEVAVNPSLKHKAVCVLSNNDGCIVSRSKEAKKIGVKMGMPYFMAKKQFPSVTYISGNLRLYREFSKKIMNILKNFSPDVEVYSIDEAFIDLTGTQKLFKKTYVEIVEMIKKEVKKQTGVGVSIGLSTSKTLAKLASDKAKDTNGIFLIGKNREDILKNTEIGEIWGIGKNTNMLLQRHYIKTAFDFIKKDDIWIKNKMGKIGLDLKQELLGNVVSKVDCSNKKPKSIQRTSSFKNFLTDKNEIKKELNLHVHEVCRKLRYYEGLCYEIGMYLKTKEFQVIYAKEKVKYGTNFEIDVLKIIMKLFEENFCDFVTYRSSGVVVSNISYSKERQMSLFDNDKIEKSHNLARTIGMIEDKYGKGAIKCGNSKACEEIEAEPDNSAPLKFYQG